jgi:hypothetical protein
VCLGIESFACGSLDKFGGGISAAVGVNFFTEPAEEGLIVAVVYGGGERREVPIGGLPKLGGGQVPQGVGGEVAEAT